MPLAAVAQSLDRVRSPALKLVLSRSAWLRLVVQSRALRIELLAVSSLLVALAVTLTAPSLLFMWAPLVLGVPHLIADVRYLVLAPYSAIPQRARDVLVLGLLAATLWWMSPTVGLAAVVVTLVLSPWRRSTRRAVTFRAGLLALSVVGCVVAWRDPITTSYVLLHAHNVVAVLLFGLVFGRGRARWLVPALMAVVVAVVAGGLVDPWLHRASLDNLAGYVLPTHALDTWPSIVCARIAVLFIFLQSVHYTIWLRLLPEQVRPRNAMRSFGASLQALQHDFGRVLVLGFALLSCGLLLWGWHDVFAARQGYLRIANFHAYLELAFLARWLAT